MPNQSTTLVPLLDLHAQYEMIRSEVQEAISRVIGSHHYILGPEVEALEQEVAAYSQCDYGVGVSSGTDALLVALMAINIRPADEVITTPFTFFATAGAIARLGAKPVFADIDPNSYNIDPSGIERLITSRTRAIIPVHLYGRMAEMDRIMEIAQRHNLIVIEDAAQAIGAEHNGQRAGSFGHFGCFSFFPSKNLGAMGDGGMVTTNDPQLADRVRLLRNHGYRPKYYNKIIGGNFRLDSIQAAVLRVKLQYLDRWTTARQKNASTYRTLFVESGIEKNNSLPTNRNDAICGIELPDDIPYGRHVYNQFVVRAARRDAVAAFLKENGIGCEVYYPVPMHLQECFAELGHKKGDFSIAEQAAHETLALPIYPELTAEMQTSVVEAIRRFYDGV